MSSAVASGHGLTLESPESMAGALPVRDAIGERPRILFADDDAKLIQAIHVSAETWFSRSLDVRSWSPPGQLTAHVLTLVAQGWRPDLVVLDINLAKGGMSGIEYLVELRRTPGLMALPVVLATGNLLRDLDLDQVTDGVGPNLTRIKPKQWLVDARAGQPEAFLYGKTGDVGFLRRLGEDLPVWRDAARRRAWNALLARVALLLDGRLVQSSDETNGKNVWSLEELGQIVADHLHEELGVDQVFVRWRTAADLYALIGVRSDDPRRDLGHLLDTSKVPLLEHVTEGGGQCQLLNGGVDRSAAGELVGWIVGKKYLGVGAVLDGRCVGFITLLRAHHGRDFMAEIDCAPFELLARLLASAVGRASRLRELRLRADHLLQFAEKLALADDETEITRGLASLLHDVLHQPDAGGSDTDGVSVRLIDFSTGRIACAARAPRASDDVPVWLWSDKSVVARTIVDGQVQRQASRTAPHRSELCVPMRVGRFSIGAAHAEHRQIDRYTGNDERFAESASTLASAAIMRLRARGFLLDLARFATAYSTRDAATLKNDLTRILETFSGASAVVWVHARDAGEPWAVEDVVVQLQGGTPERLQTALRSLYAVSWAETRLGQWVAEKAWERAWSQSATTGGKPVPLRPIESEAEKRDFYSDQSTAVLWRRPNPARPPVGAVVLLWYFDPPHVDSDIELFGTLAQLWSSLEAREQEKSSWMEQAILGEQAAALGHVMQHFQHRLRSDLGVLTGLCERMQFAVRRGDLDQLRSQTVEFVTQIAAAGEGFNKSVGYIKVPERKPFGLHDSVQDELATHDLRIGDRPVDLVVGIAPDLCCDWDEDIFRLTLFTLIENALDVFRSSNTGAPRLTVDASQDAAGVVVLFADNGTGLSSEIAAKLFRYGTTTKSNGLGSALAFARQRMRIMGGDLALSANGHGGPASGATFAIQMPCDPARRSAA